jgi:hypothetical protein
VGAFAGGGMALFDEQFVEADFCGWRHGWDKSGGMEVGRGRSPELEGTLRMCRPSCGDSSYRMVSSWTVRP